MTIDGEARFQVRPLEAFPIEREGQQWIALHDPSGFSPAQVALSSHAFFVVTHFDGQHDVADIQAAFGQRFGQAVACEQVVELARQLDEALLLDSPRFAEAYEAHVQAYLAADARPLRPESLPPAKVLDSLLRKMVQPIDGDGAVPRGARLAGLVAPHLDYPRGLACYTTAYGMLAGQVAKGCSPRLVVVLGTNHYGMKFEPVASDKDFDTPLGRVVTDGEALAQLSEAYGDDLTRGQYDHLREHSVELQVTVLARLLGADSFKVVGLLLPDACEPICQSHLDRLAGELADLADERPGEVLIVAGADLSHIGRQFGDDRPLEKAWLRQIAADERAMIDHLQAARADGFVEALRLTHNATRVCSTGSLYVLRRALADATWQDLGYHQASDVEAGVCVTCMAAALWR